MLLLGVVLFADCQGSAVSKQTLPAAEFADMGHVYQIAFVNTQKPVFFHYTFHARQGGIKGIVFGSCVDADIVIQHLKIGNLLQGQINGLLLIPEPQKLLTLRHAFHGLQNIALQYLAHIPFQNIAECLDFVTCWCIVNVVGYKEDQRMAVHLAEHPCNVNAVAILALKVNIKESHITGRKQLRRNIRGAIESRYCSFHIQL